MTLRAKRVLNSRCKTCGYAVGQLAPCPECGDPAPFDIDTKYKRSK